jgi:hypothetical protein
MAVEERKKKRVSKDTWTFFLPNQNFSCHLTEGYDHNGKWQTNIPKLWQGSNICEQKQAIRIIFMK